MFIICLQFISFCIFCINKQFEKFINIWQIIFYQPRWQNYVAIMANKNSHYHMYFSSSAKSPIWNSILDTSRWNPFLPPQPWVWTDDGDTTSYRNHVKWIYGNYNLTVLILWHTKIFAVCAWKFWLKLVKWFQNLFINQ